MKHTITNLLLASPLLVAASALPSTLETRQMVTGYQTNCVHDAAVAFDDGPYMYETDLVDELVSYGITSTLFVNGFNYDCIYDEASVISLRHALESNFTIGSHTWNHYDITLGTTDQLGAQLDLIETALMKILGVKPALFRPPYGSVTDEYTTYLNSRGYTVVGWSESGGDSGDSVGAPLDQQIATVSAATQGTILLAHETLPSTVQQLVPGTVPGLVQKGLKLMSVDRCLDVAPYQGAAVAYGMRDETWTCDGTPAPGSGQF